MTITYTLAPVPKWYIADMVGRPLAGGYMASFSSLNHTMFEPVFQDDAGMFPWPYVTIPNVGKLGILFDENGSQGPFYFAFDSANPDELYYLEIYDSNGVLQWTIDDFTPGNGGGGSIITEGLNLDNYITNNVMWRNIGATANPIVNTLLTLAPGAHAGLAQTASNAGPDIIFVKNNTTATDQIQFLKFPLGTTPLGSDVSPIDYLNYVCTNNPAGETQKIVQFPITRSVQNLSNTQVTVTIWARVNSGNGNLTLQWLQFFGDSGGSSPAAGPTYLVTPIATQLLTNLWNEYKFTVTIPNVTGGILGACGNDGLFLQVEYPLGAACNIDFTKPSVYLGTISPVADYLTYDMIDAVINAPRTGDTRSSVNSFAPFGWVAMDDGTIGSPTSGASNRANVDTFPLYNQIWNSVIDTWAPVTGGRGASAVADFAANKSIALTQALARVFAGNGAPNVLGQTAGESTHTLTIPEMPAHTHAPLAPGTAFIVNSAGAGGASGAGNLGSVATTATTGGGGAHNNLQPTTYMNFYIKL